MTTADSFTLGWLCGIIVTGLLYWREIRETEKEIKELSELGTGETSPRERQ